MVLIVLPTEDDRHKLDKDGDSDVCRADVGDQEVGRLREQTVAVLDGGQDDHVEDGGEEAEGHLDEDIHTACSHLGMKALKHQLGKNPAKPSDIPDTIWKENWGPVNSSLIYWAWAQLTHNRNSGCEPS